MTKLSQFKLDIFKMNFIIHSRSKQKQNHCRFSFSPYDQVLLGVKQHHYCHYCPHQHHLPPPNTTSYPPSTIAAPLRTAYKPPSRKHARCITLNSTCFILDFVFVLAMIYVYMIKMMIMMQFLLSLVMLKIVSFELECNQRGWNQERLNLNFVIVVICGIKYDCKVLDVKFENQFKVIWMCTCSDHNLGFHDHACVKRIFESNMFIWLKLGGLWIWLC